MAHTAQQGSALYESCRKGVTVCVVAFRFLKADDTAKFKLLWFVGVLGIAGVFLGVGAGYAWGGNHSAYSQKPFVIMLATFPHAIRAHGIILTTLAILCVFSCGLLFRDFTREVWQYARIPILASLVYSFWVTWCFAGAWWENHHYTTIMWWYFFAAILSGASASLTPSFDGERRRNDRS